MASSEKPDVIESADHEVSPYAKNEDEHDAAAADKIIQHAKAATDKEHSMTLLQGIKTYPKAVGWSILISTCIVMEGYDISLISNFYAFKPFNRKYGVQGDDGSYQVPASVRHTLSRWPATSN